jgi:hypothetical protein
MRRAQTQKGTYDSVKYHGIWRRYAPLPLAPPRARTYFENAPLIRYKPSLKKPGDFTEAEGHGHPLVSEKGGDFYAV